MNKRSLHDQLEECKKIVREKEDAKLRNKERSLSAIQEEKTDKPDRQDLAKVLQGLYDSGRIDKSDLPESIYEEMMKGKKEAYVMEVHPYRIYQGKDGRYRTHVMDPDTTDKRRSVAKHTRKELIDALYDHYKALEHPEEYKRQKIKTLRDLYPVWLEHKKLQAASDNYPVRIDSDWKKFYSDDPIADVPLSKLTPLMLEEWALKKIKAFDMTKTCYNNMTIILRQGLDYAVDMDILNKNPFRRVRIDTRRLLVKPKKKEDALQVFTDEEIRKFEALAWEDFSNPGKKVYRLAPLAALFAFYTGVRVGELTGLRFSDIEGDEIHIQRMVRRNDHKVIDHTKTECGDRYIPLTSKAVEILDAAKNYHAENSPEGSDWIFSEYRRPLPSRIVEEYFAKYCTEIQTAHKSTHCARKTYTSSLIDANININTVRKVVGHSDERTTLKNYVYDRNTSAEKKRKFEDALSF